MAKPPKSTPLTETPGPAIVAETVHAQNEEAAAEVAAELAHAAAVEPIIPDVVVGEGGVIPPMIAQIANLELLAEHLPTIAWSIDDRVIVGQLGQGVHVEIEPGEGGACPTAVMGQTGVLFTRDLLTLPDMVMLLGVCKRTVDAVTLRIAHAAEIARAVQHEAANPPAGAVPTPADRRDPVCNLVGRHVPRCGCTGALRGSMRTR